MKLLAIDATIWLDVADDADPEDVASTMDLGLRHILSDFPAGEVVKASVKTIREVSDEEADEEGLTE